MKLVTRVILAAILFLGASLSLEVRGQARVSQSASPDALVKDLYWQHDHKHSPFFQTRSRALLYKYFEQSLADLVWKDARGSKNEVGAIDGDPLYDAQDMEIKNVLIGKPTYEGTKARVEVSFENFGKKKTIAFVLVKGKTGWRISDIDYGESGTLRGWLKGKA
ncbi:MAG: hypothetical protein ACMG6H_10135 [Acidobacteriota bacterium]